MSNIKTRISKLEQLNGKSEFCKCPPFPRIETYIQDLGEDAETNEPQLSGNNIPDVCEQCRRPIEKRIITIQLCDGTTKDRFPEEWNANRH
jgi:hypothetical protein